MINYYRNAARQSPKHVEAQIRPISAPTLVIWGQDVKPALSSGHLRRTRRGMTLDEGRHHDPFGIRHPPAALERVTAGAGLSSGRPSSATSPTLTFVCRHRSLRPGDPCRGDRRRDRRVPHPVDLQRADRGHRRRPVRRDAPHQHLGPRASHPHRRPLPARPVRRLMGGHAVHQGLRRRPAADRGAGTVGLLLARDLLAPPLAVGAGLETDHATPAARTMPVGLRSRHSPE
jgi:hypothetical protein